MSKKFRNGKIKKWNINFNEWGGALDSFDGNFYLPIENLMLYVIFIITNGARHLYIQIMQSLIGWRKAKFS